MPRGASGMGAGARGKSRPQNGQGADEERTWREQLGQGNRSLIGSLRGGSISGRAARAKHVASREIADPKRRDRRRRRVGDAPPAMTVARDQARMALKIVIEPGDD